MSKIYVFEEGLGTENSSCVCRKQTGAAEQVYQNVLHDIMFCELHGKDAIKDVWYLLGQRNPACVTHS